MKNLRLIFVALLSIIMFSSTLYAATPAEQRSAISKESQTTLQMLYKAHPKSKGQINAAYGYATFSNFGVNLIFFL